MNFSTNVHKVSGWFWGELQESSGQSSDWARFQKRFEEGSKQVLERFWTQLRGQEVAENSRKV